MLTWIRGWRAREGLAQIDLYTRGTLLVLLWMTVAVQVMLSVTGPVRHSDAPVPLIVASCLVAVAQGVCGNVLVPAALGEYLGVGAVPRRLVALAAGLLAADVVAVLALTSAVGMVRVPGVTLLVCVTLVPFSMAHCLVVRRRTTLLVQLALLIGVCGVVALLGQGALALGCAISIVFGPGWFTLAVRCSAWHLGMMWQLQQAKNVQAQLAVAEERLRFGRDLHDVMGRNLAVIALKSELAVQLARREQQRCAEHGSERGPEHGPEHGPGHGPGRGSGHGERSAAMEQMAEVQRIAQESQREVRAVVRGYREADLAVELDGARGVLEAAGIECAVSGPVDGLSGAVQSALGWVVREAATNVLRHGDARRCAIEVSRSGSDATLTVENDGADAAAGADGTSGSGLAGLRERLTALDGTLVAGPAGGGRFRLTAEVPLGAVPGRGAEALGAVRDQGTEAAA
ncbi:sensor histidine kinase [Streptomyces sp. NBC_01500]|uniref:sensor histidine kinase n=1 Tax=Streptomyces sp. NBC_01500 TaxID=2903886 RepID=UPI0022578EB6|nr:histidine kinase [Streptomyces sp. NBC_01500]MCX4549347.1 histidine kinase [Streptomyces sp. NBC_01500]